MTDYSDSQQGNSGNEARLRDALESMCFQYLTDSWGHESATELRHDFMSAGEQACGVLAALYPGEWEHTGVGAKWIGPLDKFGHPLTHSWSTKLDRMRESGLTDGE